MATEPREPFVIVWSDDQPGFADALRIERYCTRSEIVALARSMVTTETQRAVVTGPSGVMFDTADDAR